MIELNRAARIAAALLLAVAVGVLAGMAIQSAANPPLPHPAILVSAAPSTRLATPNATVFYRVPPWLLQPVVVRFGPMTCWRTGAMAFACSLPLPSDRAARPGGPSVPCRVGPARFTCSIQRP